MTDPTPTTDDTPAARNKRALAILTNYGGIDGAHHKDWAIDQAVRALCGVPNGPRGYPGQASNDEYVRHVYKSCRGEDGDWAYSWETGVAP